MTTPHSDAVLTPSSRLMDPGGRDVVSRTRPDAALTTCVSMTACVTVRTLPWAAVLTGSPAAGVTRRTAADVSPRGLAAVRISTQQRRVCISDQDDDNDKDDIQDQVTRAAPAGPRPMAAALMASPRL